MTVSARFVCVCARVRVVGQVKHIRVVTFYSEPVLVEYISDSLTSCWEEEEEEELKVPEVQLINVKPDFLSAHLYWDMEYLVPVELV